MERMPIFNRLSFNKYSHAGPLCYRVLVRLSTGYPLVEGRLHTCYSPVRRSPPSVLLPHVMPLDLHVLGLSLAFILSQDQTLRCIFVLYFSWKKPGIPYQNTERAKQTDRKKTLDPEPHGFIIYLSSSVGPQNLDRSENSAANQWRHQNQISKVIMSDYLLNGYQFRRRWKYHANVDLYTLLCLLLKT